MNYDAWMYVLGGLALLPKACALGTWIGRRLP